MDIFRRWCLRCHRLSKEARRYVRSTPCPLNPNPHKKTQGGAPYIELVAGGPLEPFWSTYRDHLFDPDTRNLLESFRIGKLKTTDRYTDNMAQISSTPPQPSHPRKKRPLSSLARTLRENICAILPVWTYLPQGATTSLHFHPIQKEMVGCLGIIYILI